MRWCRSETLSPLTKRTRGSQTRRRVARALGLPCEELKGRGAKKQCTRGEVSAAEESAEMSVAHLELRELGCFYGTRSQGLEPTAHPILPLSHALSC